MESHHQKLGPQAMVDNLAHLCIEDTPQYDLYEGESQNVETFLILDDEPELTQDWVDQYVNAQILLLREYKMAKG